MQPPIIAAVAVSSATYAIDKPYSYRVPENLREQAVPGARVAVPFGRGNKSSEGVILSAAEGEVTRGLKTVEAVLDETPLLSSEQLKLALWVSSRFFCTVFDAVHAMLPAGVWYRDGKSPKRGKTEKIASLLIPAEEATLLAAQKKPRAPKQAAILELLIAAGDTPVTEIVYQTGATGASLSPLLKSGTIALTEREVFRRPAVSVEEPEPLSLTAEQTAAFDALSAELRAPDARAALLYGVTGSGKTSVYLKLIEETLALGRTAIVLVPEIALTPQLMRIFVSRFGDDVAVLHSALANGERYDEWKRIKNGSVKVAIGTRSAIFAPLTNLGLIVVDEEQEHTYKSESAPRYHAREVAKYRCAQAGALLVLGSATP
ncbi:MAG: DEAD/DEAH box helicase family protein, partial [Oscillospiraceae bacterium]|nr:DEAD/DEAH box helicase family protein [Oscillospiraceae bacterium]